MWYSPLLGRGGAWRSLVARLLWEQEVGGSNPSAPTIFPEFNVQRPDLIGVPAALISGDIVVGRIL